MQRLERTSSQRAYKVCLFKMPLSFQFYIFGQFCVLAVLLHIEANVQLRYSKKIYFDNSTVNILTFHTVRHKAVKKTQGYFDGAIKS